MPTTGRSGALLNTGVQRTLPFSPTQWWGAAYGSGVFVLPGYNSQFAARSTDGGLTWSQVTLSASARNYISIATDGNGTWLVPADGSTSGAKSTDNGATWSTATFPASGNVRAFSYGNGYFVLSYTNSSSAYRSTDGASWSTATLPAARNWYGIGTNGSGTWVLWPAVGAPAVAAAYSTDDGATWSSTASTIFGGYHVGYVRNKFFAIDVAGTALQTSTDGSTWTNTAMTSLGVNPNTAAVGNGILVTGSSSSTAVIYTSYTGTDVRSFTMPAAAAWGQAAYGSGRFVLTVAAAVSYCYTIDTMTPRAAASLTSVNRAAVF